jgi:hypothetical protein
MIVLVFAGLLGGVATAALAAPVGVLAAICAAPFGGSLLAVIAGLVLASRRSGEGEEAYDTTDKQVAALRSVLASAYPSETAASDGKSQQAA